MIVLIIYNILAFLGLIKLYSLFSVRCNSKVCLVGKTAVVTGGSSGIGYQIVLDLASRGCRVIIADKIVTASIKDAVIRKTQNPNIELKYVDLASFKSVRKFSEDLKCSEKYVDILINNAGVGGVTSGITEDGLELVLQINYYSGFLLTHLLIDLLKKSGSGRILFTSSLLSYIHDISMNRILPNKLSKGNNEISLYSDSKFCQIVATNLFAEKLKAFGITCNSWHPWIVNTPIFADALSNTTYIQHKILIALLQIGALVGKTAEEGAQTGIYLAHSKEVENVSGEFFGGYAPTYMPRGCKDVKLCQAIWECSEKAVELSPDEKLE